MARGSLQMISLCSLLMFNNQITTTTSAAARRSRCISNEEWNDRAVRLQRRYRDKLDVSQHLVPIARTCDQVATENHGGHSNRSLSPWTYSLNRDVDRFPHEIAFAECLCQGCIIGGQEDLSYNSVLVKTSLMVLKKRKKTCVDDKFVVEKTFISVPVACTCIVPKYAK